MTPEEEARDWLSRPQDWPMLPLRERRELAPAVAEIIGDPLLLRRASSFLRQAGWLDDSVAAARSAYARERSWEGAVVLAGALRAADEVDEALHYYGEARDMRPDEPGPCLDMGDMLGFENPRGEEAMDIFAEVLERCPDDPWAMPAWLYLMAEDGDPDAGERLLEMAGDDPDNAQALRLALAWRLRKRLYWGCLPGPPQGQGPLLLEPLLRISYHAQFWGPVADRLALSLGPAELAELQAVAESAAPLAVQLAACMLLSRADDEWEDTERRTSLLGLLEGGSVAACVASALLAFEQSGPREELTERLWTLIDDRPELQPVLKHALSWLNPGFPN